MNREQRKKAQRELEAKAKANEAGKAEPAKFESAEEANQALSKTARVLNMADKAKQAAEKRGKSAPRTRDEKGRLKLPPLPKSPGKPKPEKPCACGCGDMTKSVWAPGHDSYVRGWAIRVERKYQKMEDVPEAQREAVKRMIKERAAEAAGKPTAKAKKAKATVEETVAADEKAANE